MLKSKNYNLAIFMDHPNPKVSVIWHGVLHNILTDLLTSNKTR